MLNPGSELRSPSWWFIWPSTSNMGTGPWSAVYGPFIKQIATAPVDLLLGLYMALYGSTLYIWQYTGLPQCGNIWQYVAVYGSTWQYMTVQGSIWQYIAMYDSMRQYMTVQDSIWQYESLRQYMSERIATVLVDLLSHYIALNCHFGYFLSNGLSRKWKFF